MAFHRRIPWAQCPTLWWRMREFSAACADIPHPQTSSDHHTPAKWWCPIGDLRLAKIRQVNGVNSPAATTAEWWRCVSSTCCHCCWRAWRSCPQYHYSSCSAHSTNRVCPSPPVTRSCKKRITLGRLNREEFFSHIQNGVLLIVFLGHFGQGCGGYS